MERCIILATRYFSDLQEKHIAKVTGGKVQINSGGTKFGGGDVHTDKFFIEAKTPTKEKQSFSIKRDWLEKIEEQAFEQGKERWALVFTFDPDKQKNFYVISENEFLEYLRYKEEDND